MLTDLSETIKQAVHRRDDLFEPDHNTAFRLFNGFMEGNPNLCMDLFGKTLLIHDYSVTENELIPILIQRLCQDLPWIKCIIVKKRNGISDIQKRGVIVYGDEPDRKIIENGTWYAIDLLLNRDASFYIDTRTLRSWAMQNLAGKKVLNTFAYTGSLGVAALAGGAVKVLQMDRNDGFLEIARRSYGLNNFKTSRQDFLAEDFFPAVGKLKRTGNDFDCVFLDPPFFSSTDKGVVDLEHGFQRLINKVRPLIRHNGWLVSINNAIYVSGRDYLSSLEALCADGYLSIDEILPVPDDFTGYENPRSGSQPADPAPFNHSTKIVIMKVKKKMNS